MDPMLDDFKRVVQSLTFSPPTIPIVSNVTGKLATTDELTSPDYWVRHVRQAVRFLDGVRTLESVGVGLCLELGPHGVLSSMATACLSDAGQEKVALLPALRRDRPESETLALALGALHCHGVPVDWNAYCKPFDPRRVDLPTYPFQRQRYWLDAPKPSPARSIEPTGDEFWNIVERDDIDGLARLLDLHDPDQHERFAELLSSLSSWHRRQLQHTNTAAWRYAIRWTPLSELERASSRGTWLVILPASLADAELPRSLVQALSTAGLDPRVVTLEPNATRDRIARLLGDIPSEPPLVVSLLALDQSLHPEHPSLPLGLALNLALAQALADRPSPIPLWLLTQGAVSINGAEPLENPLQAMTWGFGQTFSLEHPERWGGLLDLPGDCDISLLARLPALLTRGDFEDQLALRVDGLFARRLVHAADVPTSTSRFRARGTALITGGTGALGAHVARWLAREGIERLVLTSRRGLEAPDARNLQAELEALGPRVFVVACDVSSSESVAELFARLDAEHPPLSIVVHAAGVSGDMTPIARLSCSAFAQTLASKVDGAQRLHELTRGRELDAFILFSSISATWGSGQQAAYATGNTFLDALATQRVWHGLPATSIAWGPWADGGMADDETVAYLGRRGLRPLAPEPAIGALATALDSHDVTVTVADVDWDTFAPSYAALRPRPLLANIREAAGEHESDDGNAAIARSLLDDLRQLPSQARARRLLDVVLQQTASVLGFPEWASLNSRAGFSDLGLDSLMSVELRQRLQAATGIILPATLAFDYPSPERVRDLLASKIEADLVEFFDDKLKPPDPIDPELDGLDDEDLLSAADALLGEI
jgi:acyl transferase domain-containing protein/acyl carrier protein